MSKINMIKISLEKDSLEFLKWSKNNPVGKIPQGVAKEGAGENRIPFAHLANSIPVYLTLKNMLQKSNLNSFSVLDIGCGTGRNITFVKDVIDNKKSYFYGIDYSIACIKFAKSQYGKHGVKFIQHNGEDLPFKDKSFDYIVSSHVLEHIPIGAEVKYFSEISRVLKKGGIGVIGTPNRRYCQDLFHKNPSDNEKYRLILPHIHEFTLNELKDLFEDNMWFASYEINQTVNKINRKLMVDSINKIKPKKGLINVVKFGLYSLLRKNSWLQDTMAKYGTEYMLKKMKVDYNDLVKKTYYVKGGNKEDGDNFIILTKK